MAGLARLGAHERLVPVEDLLRKWSLGEPVATAEERASEAVHRASVRTLDATHLSVPPAPAIVSAELGRMSPAPKY